MSSLFRSKFLVLFLGIPLALASLTSVVIASRSAVRDSGDFQYNRNHEGSVNFHDAMNSAQCLIQGYNIYAPDVVQKFDLACPYLPNSFIFFFPFVPLSLHLGKVLWLALNLLFTVLLSRQITALFWEKKYFFLVFALITCSAPWGTLIHFGQYTLWSLYFFLLAVKWDRENRPMLSGLAIALCLLKYVLTAPLLLYFIIYRRSWKNVALAAGIHAVIFGIFCFYLKMSPWDLFLAPVRMGKAIDINQSGYLDLFKFWSRVLGGDALFPYLLSALLVAGAWIWLLFRQKGNDDLGLLALTVMAGLTVMYHNLYDYMGAIFPLVWALKRFPEQRGWMVAAVGIVALWVLYFSSHYFEFFSHMEGVRNFMNSDVSLIFESSLWYLGLGLLWVQLKAAGSLTANQSLKTKG